MTNLLDDLAEVVRLADKATPDVWLNDGTHLFIDTRVQVCCGRGHYECCGSPDVDGDVEEIGNVIDENDADCIAAMHKFIRAHASEIERNARDAELGRAYRRWYAAAKGHRNVIADDANEFIVSDAMREGGGE